MARPIVTQALVNDAAEALTAEGTEPSILNVRARIGGGSYSTVKKYLDAWIKQRAETVAAAPELPPEVEAKGRELTRALWTLAAQQAGHEAHTAREQATAEVAAIREELAEARNEIARLEALEAEQSSLIEQTQARLRETELQLAEAKAQAVRAAELQQALAQCRAELDSARQEAKDKAVEAGRLSGEAEALRAQVGELMAALKPKSGGGRGKG
jgi:chromosome segregation ATPase